VSAQNRIVAGGVALVALIAAFWFLLLAPKRADISAANAQIAQVEARRDAARTSAQQAERDRAGYVRDYQVVARLGKAVPADDDIASLVYQLETIARANDIDFRTVKLTASAAATPATTPSNAAAAGTNDKKPAGADETSTATATVAPPVVAQPPPGAVVGEAGLVTVPFTLTFDGDYMKLQRLLKAINALAKNDKSQIKVQGRLLTVDGFSLAAGPDGFPQLKATVSATAYLAPSADEAAAANAQAPAGATPGTSTTTAIVTPNAQGAGR
jgi:Tfp pilus assembly protein PilO